jgi:NADPH:quinone reductase-like Zn-dependent oxidoreductase
VRFAEVALLALPFVVFVAWRLMAPSVGPPRVLVIAVTGAVGAMAVLLFALWYEEAAPPGAAYVPAQLEDGKVLPSQVLPRNGSGR